VLQHQFHINKKFNACEVISYVQTDGQEKHRYRNA